MQKKRSDSSHDAAASDPKAADGSVPFHGRWLLQNN